MGILQLNRPRIIYGREELHDRNGTVLHFFCHMDRAIGFVLVVLVCEGAPLHIATANQILIDCLREILGYLNGLSLGVGQHLVLKQPNIHFPRPVCQGLCQSTLQCLRKQAKLHVGDERQLV